jgi:hypothetical protein
MSVVGRWSLVAGWPLRGSMDAFSRFPVPDFRARSANAQCPMPIREANLDAFSSKSSNVGALS